MASVSLMHSISAGGAPFSLRHIVAIGFAMLAPLGFAKGASPESNKCARVVKADVVAIDQPLMFNRLGAQNINGMVYALKRDVVDDSPQPKPLALGGSVSPGHVFLRPDKRPRPLTLRVAAGDCLDVTLTNLLTSAANPRSSSPFAPPRSDTPMAPDAKGVLHEVKPFGIIKEDGKWQTVDDQVVDRMVGFHVQGMQLRDSVSDDSSMVGLNPNSMVTPGKTTTYHLYAEHEGTFLATSHGATFGGDATAGNSSNGLFGAVNVEPSEARIYRSQVTDEEIRLAASTDSNHIGGAGQPRRSPAGQPIVDYEAIYPDKEPWKSEGKAGLPILNMMKAGAGYTETVELVHSDINAIIAGPDDDGSWTSRCPKPLKPGQSLPTPQPANKWDKCPYPLEKVGHANPSLPDRLEPFREFTVIFHDEMSKQNAFQKWYDSIIDPEGANHRNPLAHTLKAVGDVFLVNYGSGGIGSEMIANRLGVGPMHDCLGCSAEEFFLTSHAVGDPAMVVDIPANFGMEECWPKAYDDGKATEPQNCGASGPKATKAYYPDDPSNVHHSYISDHVKFRNLHTGKEHHIFHLHNHQWLYNPNDDNANYLDAQAIGPGSGYTYEINFGGSGNRNKSAGDAIFHCHLYPHFAQGMWELWRIHDVLESGTPLQVSGGVNDFHTKLFGLQDGLPMALGNETHARALPDGEIAAGTPIPGIVPLPGKAMAPMPGRVTVVAKEQKVLQKFFDKDPGRLAPAGSVARVDRFDTDPSLKDTTETPLKNPLNPDGLKNPGYPFWIAGIEHSVGQRPPTPPLDMMPKADEPAQQKPGDPPNKKWAAGGWDGGLPRHALDGVAVAKKELEPKQKDEKIPLAAYAANTTRLDLSKKVKLAKPYWFPEDGTDIEKAAMSFHAKREHESWAADLKGNPSPKKFLTNGSGRPIAGAPFHDPCVDDKGHAMNKGVLGEFFDGRGGFSNAGSSPFTADQPRVYKGADIQFDAVLNKAGWHFPQQRIVALWEDAIPIISKQKAPEPLVMRSNTFDCTMFLHANLVPEYYELDDFEVKTSTDIIGQHIHLPKWDLTTTDGSGNGWNYEDGTLAPGAVRERITAINAYSYTQKKKGLSPIIKDVEGKPIFLSKNLLGKTSPVVAKPLDEGEFAPEIHPYFPDEFPKGASRTQYWAGARTTLQRWFFDPVVNVNGTHRGLGIIFTHDHFGPSTHQQVGLYATVLVEPAGSLWTHNETDELLYDTTKRKDGGPTSWQAMIKTGQKPGYVIGEEPAKPDIDGDGEDDSYREFYLEYSDFQHAYLPGKYVGADQNGAIEGRHETTVRTQKDGKPETKLAFAAPDKKVDPYAPDANSYKYAINPPVKNYEEASLDQGKTLARYAIHCPPDTGGNSHIPRPCPEAITADDPGTMVVNYRNEPIGLRIQDTSTGGQAKGAAGDLAYALQTFTKHRHLDEHGENAERAYRVLNATFGKDDGSGRRDVLNAQPRGGDRIGSTCFPAVLQPRSDSGSPGVTEPCKLPDSDGKASAKSIAKKGDPFTPLMRVYYGDRVRLKVQAGGDEETHNVTVHGMKWLQGGSGFGFAANSGWRNSQQAGISEQFTFAAPILPWALKEKKASDRGYQDAIKEADEAERAGRSQDDDSKQRDAKEEEEIRTHKKADYLYSVDASTEGYWNGMWGLIRGYGKWRKNLAALPNNPYTEHGSAYFDDAKKICPLDASKNPLKPRRYDVVAVLANDVLDNAVGATLPPGPWTSYRLPRTEPNSMKLKGTLVYNPRKTAIPSVILPADPGESGGEEKTTPEHLSGVLHDPTAIMYVRLKDLELRSGAPASCMRDGKLDPEKVGASCPASNLRIKALAPVEPLVLRAAAGDCIEVNLYNWIDKDGAPDMMTYRALSPVIPRHPDNPNGSVLNANNVRTSNVVGLHPALVAYDMTQDDGAAVGINDDEKTVIDPSERRKITYEWYAGDISIKPQGPLKENAPRKYDVVHTPIEFGGVPLMPADKIKQGQKGLVGALVIEPEGSTWNDSACDDRSGAPSNCTLDQVNDHQGGTGMRETRLSATVTTKEGRKFRDLVTVIQKGLTQVYGDGWPVEGLEPEGVVSEDTEDGGAMAINYGSEPLWFRFGLSPVLPFTGGPPASGLVTSFAHVPNAHEAYSENLLWNPSAKQRDCGDPNTSPPCKSGSPAVPVLSAHAGEELRMRVIQPAGPARGSVFNLHGHIWQRAPYNCPKSSYLGLPDVCRNTGFFPTLPPFEVGSRGIGPNPMSMYLGGQDSVLPAGHFDIVVPHAGGAYGVKGDYLYKDQGSFGNLGGLWGVLRVE